MKDTNSEYLDTVITASEPKAIIRKTENLTQEEYDKFLEEKSQSLRKKIMENIDVYTRLADR